MSCWTDLTGYLYFLLESAARLHNISSDLLVVNPDQGIIPEYTFLMIYPESDFFCFNRNYIIILLKQIAASLQSRHDNLDYLDTNLESLPGWTTSDLTGHISIFLLKRYAAVSLQILDKLGYINLYSGIPDVQSERLPDLLVFLISFVFSFLIPFLITVQQPAAGFI